MELSSAAATAGGGIFTGGSIDLTGDGRPEDVRLRDGQAVVYALPDLQATDRRQPDRRGPTPAQEVWQSEPGWHVVDVALGDPNDDGRGELLLALQKPDRDGVLRSHPFIIGYRAGIYRTLWGGSAVVRPLAEVEVADVDGDGIQELIVLEESQDGVPERRTVSVWRWHGWGFSLLWRSPPDGYHDLHIVPGQASDTARHQRRNGGAVMSIFKACDIRGRYGSELSPE